MKNKAVKHDNRKRVMKNLISASSEKFVSFVRTPISVHLNDDSNGAVWGLCYLKSRLLEIFMRLFYFWNFLKINHQVSGNL